VTEVWLGVIAVAVLLMAIMQVVVGLQLVKAAREATLVTQELRKEIQPLIAKAHKVADDAQQLSALARAQVERVDAVMASMALRVDDTVQLLQDSFAAPVRQGAAVMAGLKAALAVFRARQDKGRYGRDDEDALFIG
jgi:uncharacterized protein YoxC